MPKRPRYEDRPSKLLIQHLEYMFPGFRPTPGEWRSVEKALREQYEDQPRKPGSHLATLPDDIARWSGKDLLSVLMQPPAVVNEPIPHVQKDSRRGKKTRDCGLTCTEMLFLLAEEDAVVRTMKPPAIRQRMIKKWDRKNPEKPVNSFSIRTIRQDPLFKQWQKALSDLLESVEMSESEFRNEGLAILSYKPGREDKRREGRAKTEQAVRAYLAAVDNTDIQAKREIEAKKAARGGGGRQ